MSICTRCSCSKCRGREAEKMKKAYARGETAGFIKRHKTRKIKSWYNNGALVTDRPVPGCSCEILSLDEIKFYGKKYMIAESMTESAAAAISKGLGLDYQGYFVPLTSSTRLLSVRQKEEALTF